MPFMRMGPACPSCGDDCVIESDDFNRADGDDPGNYTEVGGSDYDISSNELLCATAGLLICDTAHPGGATEPQRVERKFKFSATTEHAGVVLGYQDASNYLHARVQQVSSCWVLRLFKVVAGAATEVQDAQTIGDGVPVDTWHTLEACLASANYPTSGDIFRAKVTLDGGKVYGSQADSGDYAGGTKGGIDDSANVRCDDFSFEWMQDEDDPDHDNCPDCTTPCLIESDAFPGGSETTCKWDSGKLRVFHPELGTKHYATATFDLADGENAEVRVNMTSDGSAYHWGKLALSGTTLTLTIGKTGTTLDTKTRSASAGTFTLAVCFNGTLVTGGGGSLSAAQQSTVVADGIYAGRAGTADFTYFEFQKHYAPGNDSACPNCEEPTVDCTVCCNDLPFYMAVDVDASLTEFSDACDGCTSIGGTYIAPSQANNVFDPDPCLWLFDMTMCTVPRSGDGWCWSDPFSQGTQVAIGLRVALSLLKNASTGKCYWSCDVSAQRGGGLCGCYNASETGSCGCDTGCDCAASGCLDVPIDGAHIDSSYGLYQSVEFDVGQCPSFPTSLSKVEQGTGFPCKGDWPDTISIAAA